MKQYNLGPNGGIVTSLNLFATRFDQVSQSDSATLDTSYYLLATVVSLVCMCVKEEARPQCFTIHEISMMNSGNIKSPD